jgi:hypothetical protein
MPIETPNILENMIRSSRENYAKVQAREIAREIHSSFLQYHQLETANWLAEKLNNVLLEYSGHMADVAKRYAAIVVDPVTDAALNDTPQSLLQSEHAANEDRSIKFKPGRGAGTNAVTTFSKNDGERIEIWHNKPLLNTLGADLLSSIRWWHSGSVRRSDSD